VRHDAARPFVVRLAGHEIQDVGTSFNLVRAGERLGVEVIDGKVLFDPSGSAVPLEAGQTLLVRASGPPVLARRDPQSIAGWRRGQLSFSGSPLEIVASDLSRSLGVNVGVAPSIRTLPFTGSIRVGGDPGAAVTGFASTLGLRARRTGNDWLIEPGARARR
jgi:transmembrane sensor